MTTHALPAVEQLPSLSTKQRADVLDILFEPSEELHALSEGLLKSQAFESYNKLIAQIGAQLTELADESSPSHIERLEAILGSHPRLGATKVDSAQSKEEQAQLQQGGADEVNALRQLNEEYEKKFPGLRYVVFVNGRSRPAIMADMRHRIAQGDAQEERLSAIMAMCQIAADRAGKLQSQ